MSSLVEGFFFGWMMVTMVCVVSIAVNIDFIRRGK
jgi:hypothetical protein